MALEFLYFRLNAIYLWRMFYILSPVGFGDSAGWLYLSNAVQLRAKVNMRSAKFVSTSE